MSPRWLVRRISTQLTDRLVLVPLLFVVGSVVLAQITTGVDSALDGSLPTLLETSVEPARAVLSTIAGGLISAITLLLSLVLVSVQLASSQFSPRTVRDWISDRVQQRTIGIVLGTIVFCLLVLRETQSGDDGQELAPHLSVLLAVAFAIVSLVAVVRNVDHLSNSMRIGAVARSLADETARAARRLDDNLAFSAGGSQDASHDRLTDGDGLVTPSSGWVQRVELDVLGESLGEGGRASLLVRPGMFVFPDQLLAWVEGDADVSPETIAQVFEIADHRLIENDMQFGLLQMTDIALRALSPGINDPNTACDVIVHVGAVLIEAWKVAEPHEQIEVQGATIDILVPSHEEYLQSALAQILRYGAEDFVVLSTIRRVLESVKREAQRRDLPGPLEPIDNMLDEIDEVIAASNLSQRDKRRLAEI